jgi:hypothetical protein
MEVLYEQRKHIENIAEYKGKKVTLNKPMRGDVKKYKVYVKNPKTGKVIKVNFGDKNMKIRRESMSLKNIDIYLKNKCQYGSII